MYRIYKKDNRNKIVLFASDLVSVAKFIIPHLNKDIETFIIIEDQKIITLPEIRKMILLREKLNKSKRYAADIKILDTKLDNINLDRKKDIKKHVNVYSKKQKELDELLRDK